MSLPLQARATSPAESSRQSQRVLRQLLIALCALALWAGRPATAQAKNDEDAPKHDARLDGYDKSYAIDGSAAAAYVVMVLIAGLPVAVMFIDAKRSHLD